MQHTVRSIKHKNSDPVKKTLLTEKRDSKEEKNQALDKKNSKGQRTKEKVQE